MFHFKLFLGKLKKKTFKNLTIFSHFVHFWAKWSVPQHSISTSFFNSKYDCINFQMNVKNGLQAILDSYISVNNCMARMYHKHFMF